MERLWPVLRRETYARVPARPDYPILLSLEHHNEETDPARKAALFTKRTLKRVTSLASSDEQTMALAASMQSRGRVDRAYMGQLPHRHLPAH